MDPITPVGAASEPMPPRRLEVMSYLSDRGFQPTFMAPVLMDGPIRAMELTA